MCLVRLLFCSLFLSFSSFSFGQTVDTSCPSIKVSGFSLTDDQGVAIGVAIAGVFCVAGIFKVLASGGSGED